MKKGFFITGTDTGVGKTWATVALMRYFQNQGYSVLGMKPIAAGCILQDGQLKNEDALLLQENGTQQLSYKEINPYAFEMPVSPHLASVDEQVQVDVILHAFNKLKDKADIILVEGAGGWLSPINNQNDMADIVKALEMPVVLVVAIRLGCINHARLTFQAIQAAGTPCAGWMAMCVDPRMMKQEENIKTIKNKITAPLLGVLPYTKDKDFNLLAKYLSNL